jgi:hypothetical protein
LHYPAIDNKNKNFYLLLPAVVIGFYIRKNGRFSHETRSFVQGMEGATLSQFEDHKRMAQVLASIKGKFLLTINDHPEIRKLYKKFARKKIAVKYSIARDKSLKARDRTELIIANYPLPRLSSKK